MGRPSRLNVSDVNQNETWSPLHVTHIASGDSWAGAEVQLFHVARQLAREPGLALDVVLMNSGELEQRLREAGIIVTVLDETRLTSMALLRSLIKHVKSVKPDVIHSHRRKENLLAAVARLFVPNVVNVSTIHSVTARPDWIRIDQHVINIANLLVLRSTQQCCIAVSDELGGRLRASLGKHVRVVENGVDIERIIEESKLGQNPADPDGTIRVGVVARLVQCKRIDIAVETAALLKGSVPNRFEFFIFGDGALRENIQRQIDASGLADVVHLMGFQDNLPAALSHMDVMMMPSDHEGLPMALLEAMALEVPVVAHAVGGIPHVLGHGRAGWLVSKQTPECYAEVLRQMLSNTEPFWEKARQARRVLEEAYSSRKTASRYKRIYYDLVNAGH